MGNTGLWEVLDGLQIHILLFAQPKKYMLRQSLSAGESGEIYSLGIFRLDFENP